MARLKLRVRNEQKLFPRSDGELPSPEPAIPPGYEPLSGARQEHRGAILARCGIAAYPRERRSSVFPAADPFFLQLGTMANYKIAVQKDYLVFAAAHFITYGGKCEKLHGHNYRVRVELVGTLDQNAYVLDFILLKQIMRPLVDELDHKMLLPLSNPHLDVEADDGAVHVRYRDGEREYLFPRGDVLLLPIMNTTAEMLAWYLAGRLREELAERGADNIVSLAVEVEESFGQSATYQETLRE